MPLTLEDTPRFKLKMMEAEKKAGIKGKKLGKIETAKKMLEKEYSIEEIADVTELTIKEIKNLQEKRNFPDNK